MFCKMLEDDRRRAGWSMGQVAWRLGVSVREYRELEAGERSPNVRDVGSDLQDVRLAAVVP
jgi:predicted transcriptional regulator